MDLTPQQSARLHEQLKIWDAVPCEACGSKEWATNGNIYELREFRDRGDMLFPGQPVSILPVVALHCKKCGNTKFLSAIGAGLIDPQTGKRVPKPETSGNG